MYGKGPGPGVLASRRVPACRVREQPCWRGEGTGQPCLWGEGTALPAAATCLWAWPGCWEGLPGTWVGELFNAGQPQLLLPSRFELCQVKYFQVIRSKRENSKLPLCFREKGQWGWGTSVRPQVRQCCYLFYFFQRLLPDPILKLRTIIGFGGCSTKWVSSLDGLGSMCVITD